ncbi:MAG: thioredoxin family protein [Flavobacteriales bacterium]
MKYFLVVIFFIFQVTTAIAQDSESVTWLTNLEQAQEQAKQNHKTIFVYFTGSDWCSPCKMLKEDFFENPKFIDKAKDFILVKIDSPYRTDIISKEQMAYNKKVIAKYNKDKKFPKLIALDAKGRVQGKIEGYGMLRDTSYYFTFIEDYKSL